MAPTKKPEATTEVVVTETKPEVVVAEVVKEGKKNMDGLPIGVPLTEEQMAEARIKQAARHK